MSQDPRSTSEISSRLVRAAAERKAPGLKAAGKERKTDKAFLIAKPMIKADWTKCFAAGWGERGAANGRGELAESG
jgi:hypothetical protein